MRQSKLPVGLAVCGLLMAALFVGRAVLQAQSAPVLNPAQVSGPNVTFTWSGVPGASGYVLQAGAAPGAYLVSLNVGNTSTFSVQAPAPGTYFVRVVALVNGVPIPSNEIAAVVTSMFLPPAAPTNFAVYLNGTAALLTWDAGSGGGAPTVLVLHAGRSPGAADVAQVPLPAGATSVSVPNVPAGTYYLRVYAVNQGGASPPSNEAALAMPAGGGCSAPPARAINSMVFGRYVRLGWPLVPGASAYHLSFTGPASGGTSLPGNVGSLTVPSAPLGVYSLTLTTQFQCGQTTAGPAATLTVDGAPPPGPRTPDPAPGTRLPLPNMLHVVRQLADERPDLLHQSCREHGGNNRFLFELVRRLRARDNRFGLNWKRGNVGDMSQDIVNYNASSASDEGAVTPNVYVVDTIGGHCGSNPGPNWQDQTGPTIAAGTRGIWTLIPYLDAGYPVVSDQPQQ